jgi:polysaccharide pyruvyl transferase WcaK-like protein
LKVDGRGFMKIGIWGSYNYGNYGDDVMAIIFAKAMEKEGHTPIVYRLNSTIANNFGIKVTNSLLEFMNETEVVVIGGGGMLVSTSRIRSLINHVDKEFENDFNRLQSLLIKDSKPVIAVSIGGDGLGAKAYLSKKRS